MFLYVFFRIVAAECVGRLEQNQILTRDAEQFPENWYFTPAVPSMLWDVKTISTELSSIGISSNPPTNSRALARFSSANLRATAMRDHEMSNPRASGGGCRMCRKTFTNVVASPTPASITETGL